MHTDPPGLALNAGLDATGGGGGADSSSPHASSGAVPVFTAADAAGFPYKLAALVVLPGCGGAAALLVGGATGALFSALISTFPMGLYADPTGAIGSTARGASFCTEYFAPEAASTRFMITSDVTSNYRPSISLPDWMI